MAAAAAVLLLLVVFVVVVIGDGGHVSECSCASVCVPLRVFAVVEGCLRTCKRGLVLLAVVGLALQELVLWVVMVVSRN